MLGLRGIALQLLAQMTHVHPHIVAVFGVRRAPYFAQNLTMRQHFAGIGDQQGKQTIFNRSQMYGETALMHGTQAQIDFDVSEFEIEVNSAPAHALERDGDQRRECVEQLALLRDAQQPAVVTKLTAVSKAEFLAAARKPLELLQVAASQYLTHDSFEKAELLKTMVSNYTVKDVLRIE